MPLIHYQWNSLQAVCEKIYSCVQSFLTMLWSNGHYTEQKPNSHLRNPFETPILQSEHNYMCILNPPINKV